ncbi:MAG TPA: type II CAAX endopeptidase family protein [Bdellovibrionota bacterium]|jgi:membrane protease YdiL (CAAX protease family)|nr:type II CAAX endopeptidase family protein [Bdellovibrionota bacterium]
MTETIFGVLMATVFSVIFLRMAKVSFWGLVAVLLAAFVQGRVGAVGLFAVVALMGAGYGYYLRAQTKGMKMFCALVFVLISVALSARLFPLFQNWQIVAPFRLSDISVPYALWWNFEKPILAIVIGGFAIASHRDTLVSTNPVRVALVGVLGIAVTISLAYAWGYIAWEPKAPAIFWLWALTNLLITCAGEEAFFRGFILKELDRALSTTALQRAVPLLVSSLLFGLAHYAGGLKYMILASVAGIFYGLVYRMTGRLWVSVVLHLLLNATHFLLFTYPAIQQT